MRRDPLTDSQVEAEIERLKESPLVKLAQKERRIRNKRRQYMYKLRNDEFHGRELAAAGVTMESLLRMEREADEA